ncbi:uncharacterized protein LOC135332984 [Halichondria panicea]|uniref:uncharacterized protein LOC135332984 n=1 Tax=Halichondria panicea TaxID=6063 RepID=UPI00312B7CC5
MAGRFVEAAFRSLAVAAGIGSGVAGGFTVNQLFTISRTTIPFNNTDQPIELLINEINPNLMLYTRVSAGLALGLGALSFFLAISIFIRVCKCEAGTAIKCIFTIDFIIVIMCILGFAAGGVLGAIGANSWSRDIVDKIDIISPVIDIYDVLEPTRTLLAATAATSLFASLAFVALKYWLIIFSARNCDLVYNGWI